MDSARPASSIGRVAAAPGMAGRPFLTPDGPGEPAGGLMFIAVGLLVPSGDSLLPRRPGETDRLSLRLTYMSGGEADLRTDW